MKTLISWVFTLTLLTTILFPLQAGVQKGRAMQHLEETGVKAKMEEKLALQGGKFVKADKQELKTHLSKHYKQKGFPGWAVGVLVAVLLLAIIAAMAGTYRRRHRQGRRQNRRERRQARKPRPRPRRKPKRVIIIR